MRLSVGNRLLLVPAPLLALACILACASNLQTTLAQNVCESDTDCKLTFNYCGGCNCEALPAASEELSLTTEECPDGEPAFNCLVDPCSLGQTASCTDNGQCAVLTAPTPAPTTCQICQGGSPVPDPTLYLTEFEATCGDLETEVQSGLTYYPCSVYEYFGALCGCPDQTPPTNGCRLCQDGSTGSVSAPDLTLGDYTNQTCGELELEADYITDEIYDCGQYAILGNVCGCDNPPPDYGCGPLCNDGTEVPDPDLYTSYGVCGDLEIQAIFNPYNESCDAGMNAYQGWLCGCDNDPPEDACGSLCGADGGSIPDSEMILISMGLTCGEIEEISLWDTLGTCEDYVLYASLCGCNITVPEDACGPLCEDGSELPNPDQLAFGETCEGWEAMSVFDTRTEACPDYKYLGATCGCDNAPPEGSCGPLCGTDEDLPDATKVVYGQTCQQWEYDSLFDTYSGEYCYSSYGDVAYLCGCTASAPTDGCGPLCTDGTELPDPDRVVQNTTCRELELESLFDFDGPVEGWCGEYQYLGSLCGCDNSPPEDACLLCDGPIEHPDKVSYDLYGETYTCEADAAYYAFTYTAEDDECEAFRSVFGPYCGCAVSPDKSCEICSKDEMNTLELAPEFSYTDAVYGDVDIAEEGCLNVEFLTNLDQMSIDEESCGEIRAQVAADCCVKDASNGAGQEEAPEQEAPVQEEGGGGQPQLTPAPAADSTTSGAHHLSMFTTRMRSIVVASIMLFTVFAI